MLEKYIVSLLLRDFTKVFLNSFFRQICATFKSSLPAISNSTYSTVRKHTSKWAMTSKLSTVFFIKKKGVEVLSIPINNISDDDILYLYLQIIFK